MADIVFYHNPRCSKSRAVKEILESKGVDFQVIEYLKTPPDAEMLRALLERLDVAPADLVRRDDRFRELGLTADDLASPEAVVDVLVRHPELLQRPVVVRGDRAVIGRPPEAVETLL